MFMLGGVLVALSSRKEPVVALSSCEDEYITYLLYAFQATWMMNLVKEITGKNHGEMTMKIDNMLAVNMDKNPIAHRRSKHI